MYDIHFSGFDIVYGRWCGGRYVWEIYKGLQILQERHAWFDHVERWHKHLQGNISMNYEIMIT